MLRPASKSKCTCLELFLIQHSAEYSESIKRYVNKQLSVYVDVNEYADVIYAKQFSKCVNNSFAEAITRCNFTKRINNCVIQQASSKKSNAYDEENNDFLFYVYDWTEMIHIMDRVLPKYVNLLLSIVAIGVNAACVVILSRIKTRSQKTIWLT